MKTVRLYADTSVFGGCFDDEFAVPSRALFREVAKGRFRLVLSATTMRELAKAPDHVRALLADIGEENLELVPESDEIDDLRDAYLEAHVVGPACSADAEHIAAASVAAVDLVVSWNFKHIVHFDKIRLYHAVNLVQGYHSIPIHTPQEVVDDEREEL